MTSPFSTCLGVVTVYRNYAFADVRNFWALWSSTTNTTVSACKVSKLTYSQQLLKLNPICCCRGANKETRGTAYVVYEDIYDAKTAVEHLSGFNVANRYLIVLYYNHQKHSKKVGVNAGCATLFKTMLSFNDMMCVTCLISPSVQQSVCIDKLHCSSPASSVAHSRVCAAEYQGQGRGVAEDARKVWSGCRAASPKAQVRRVSLVAANMCSVKTKDGKLLC